MEKPIIKLIEEFAKADDPTQAFAQYLSDSHCSYTSEMDKWYSVVQKIYSKGRKQGFKNGKRNVIEELHERFPKEEE